MSEETIYLVRGTVGEYSDRDEWPVAAYFDQKMASAHVLAAEAHARVVAESSEGLDYEYDTISPDTLHPWDTEFDTEYECYYRLRKIRYFVEVVTVARCLPGPAPS